MRRLGREECCRRDATPCSLRARNLARTHARTQVCNSVPLFTRILFSIDPLCARTGIRSWLPALLGLFIRLPVTATLFKAPQDFCPGSIPPSSFPTLVSFAPLSLFASLSLYPKSGLPPLSASLDGTPRLFWSSIDGQPDARQQGRLYVLPRLSVARLPRRFPIYFRILPLATRRDVTRPGLCALAMQYDQIEAPISCHGFRYARVFVALEHVCVP